MNAEYRRAINSEIAGPVRTNRPFERYLQAFNIPLEEGRTILDVGAGDGGFATKAREHGMQVVRMDPDYHYNPPADKNASVAGIVQELPFADDSFDDVTAYFSCYYVKTGDTEAIGEMLRVTKPGGRVQINPGILREDSDGNPVDISDIDIIDVRTNHEGQEKTITITKPHNTTKEDIFELAGQIKKKVAFHGTDILNRAMKEYLKNENNDGE